MASWALLLTGSCALAPSALRPRPVLLRRGHAIAQLDEELTPLAEPRDELKRRFGRGEEEDAPDNLTPARQPARDAEVAAAGRPSVAAQNDALRAEIEQLMAPPAAPAPEKRVVDLNGIKPTDLLLGAFTYAVVGWGAWQFTNAAGAYFAENEQVSDVYVVARLQSIARVVVVAMGALGTGVTSIAAVGQLALAVQVAIGILKGELDPNAPRKDPTGGRRRTEVERLWAMMQGKGKEIR